MQRREISVIIVNNISALRHFTSEVLKEYGLQKISSINSINEIGDFDIPRRNCLYIIEFDYSKYEQDDLDYLAGLASITTFSNNKIIFTSKTFDGEVLGRIKLIKTKELILKTNDLQAFSDNLKDSINKLFPKLSLVENTLT